MSDRAHSDSALVQFSERLTNSAAFGNLFREGMDLVEETAAYLDGAGRTEAKTLDRAERTVALPHERVEHGEHHNRDGGDVHDEHRADDRRR